MIYLFNLLARYRWIGIVVFALSLLFIGISCGGGSGGGGGGDDDDRGETILYGAFVDSPVEGIEYETDSFSGITDSSGRYNYKEGEIVIFSIGDIVIGQTLAKATITPVDLVDGAVDVTNPIVTNISRFLQSLDNDDNLENGISIIESVRNEAIGMSINFDLAETEFGVTEEVSQAVASLTAPTEAGQRELISIADAQDHLNDTLSEIYFVSDDVDRSISGHVFDQITNLPVSNCSVSISYHGTDDNWNAMVYTDENGFYIFEELDGNGFTLSARSASSSYAPTHYNEQVSFYEADKIYVGEGQHISNIDFLLKEGITVSGYIYDEDNNLLNLPDGVAIILEVWDAAAEDYAKYSSCWGVGEQEGDLAWGVILDGYYEIYLSPGEYIIKAYSENVYLSEWYHSDPNADVFNITDPSQAGLITAQSAPIENVNFYLDENN